MSLRSTQSGFKPPRSSKPNILKTLSDMHRIFNEILEKSLQFSSSASYVMMQAEPVRQLSKLQGQQEILSSLCSSQEGISKQLAFIQQSLELVLDDTAQVPARSVEFASGDFAKVSKLLSRAQKQILACIKNGGSDDSKLVASVWDVFNTLNLEIWNKCFSNNLLQDAESSSTDIRNKLFELNDENEELKKQLASTKTELASYKAGVRKGEMDMTSPVSRRRDKPRSVDRAENVPQLKKEILNNYDMIRTLHTEIDEKTVFLEQKDAKIQELIKEIASLKSKLKDRDTEIDPLRSSTTFTRSPVRSFKFYQNEIEYLREQLNAAKDEKEKTLRGSLQNNNEEGLIKKLQAEHEKEVARLKEHVDFLRKRLSEVTGPGRSSRGFSPVSVSASTQSLLRSPSAEKSTDVHERLQRERERSLTLYRALKRKERDLEEVAKNPDNKVAELLRANSYLENKVNLLEDEIRNQRKVNSELQQIVSDSGYHILSDRAIQNNLSPLDEYISPQPKAKFSSTFDFRNIDRDYDRLSTETFNPGSTGYGLSPKNMQTEIEKYINLKASENTKKLDSIFLSLTEKDNKLKALEQKLNQLAELKKREINQLKNELESKKAELREALLVNNLDKEDFNFKYNKIKENQTQELENLYKELDFLKEKMKKADEANVICKNKDEEKNKLVKEIEKLQADLVSKNQQIDKLILEHTQYKNRHSENSDKLNNLMLDLLAKKDRFKNMKREIHEKDEEITRIRQLNDQLNTELKHLNDKLEAPSKDYEELKQSYNQQRAEFNALQLKLTQNTKDELLIEKMRYENSKLNTENMSIKKQLDKLNSEFEALKESYDEQSEQLEEAIEKLQANTSILESTEVDLQNAREDAMRFKGENKKLNALLVKRNDQINELKKDKDAMAKILDEKVDELNGLIEEFNKGHELIEQLDSHNQALKAENDAIKEQMSDAMNKVERLEAEVDEARIENDKIRSELLEKENRLEELNKNETLGQKLQSDYHNLVSQKETLEKDYSELLKEYQAKVDELHQKTVKLTEKDKITSEKDEEIRRLKGYNEKLSTENKIFSNEAKKLSRDIESFKQRYELLLQENNSLKDIGLRIDQQRLEYEDRENLLEHEIAEKSKEIDTLHAEIDEMRNGLDLDTKKLKLEISRNLDEMKALKLQKEKSEAGHKKIIDSLQKTLEEKRNEIEKLKVINTDLEIRLEDSHSDLIKIQDLESQISQLNTEHEQVKQKYTKNTEKLESEILLCNHEITKITQIYENLKAENAELNRKLVNYTDQSEELARLEEANQEIRSDYELKLERLEQDLKSYTYNVGTLTEKYNELKYKYNEAKSQLDAKNKELNETSGRLNDYNNRHLYYEDLIQQLKIELKTKEQELETYFLKQSDLVAGLSSRDNEVGLLLEQIKILQSENKDILLLKYQYEEDILQKDQNIKKLEKEIEDLAGVGQQGKEKSKGRKVLCESLKSQVQDATLRIEQLLNEKNRIEVDLANTQLELETIHRQFQELDLILQDSKQENISLIEERLHQINTNQKLQDDLDQLKSQHKQLKDTTHQDILTLTHQLTSKEEELASLNNTITSLTQEYEDLKQKSIELLAEIEAKRIENLSLQEDLQKKSMKYMSANLDLEAVKAQLSKLNEECEELASEVNFRDKELEIVRKEYDSLKQEHSDLNSEYSALRQTLDAMELNSEESNNLRDLVNQKDRDLESLRERNAFQEKELIQGEIQIEELKQKLEEKKREYEDSVKEIENIKNEIENSKKESADEIEELKKHAQHMLQQKAQEIQDLKKQQKQLLQGKNKEIEELIEKGQADLKQALEEIQSLRDKQETILQQKDIEIQEIKNSQAQLLLQAAQEIQILKDHLESIISHKSEEIEELKKQQEILNQKHYEEIEELKKQHEDIILKKSEEIEELKKQHEDIILQKSEEIEELKKQQELLNKKHDEEIEELRESLNLATSHKSEQSEIVRRYEDLLQTKSAEVEHLKLHYEQLLQHKLIEIQDIKKHYDNILQQIAKENDDLHTHLSQISQERAQKIEELKNTEKYLKELEQRSDSLSIENESLKLSISHFELDQEELQHIKLRYQTLLEEFETYKGQAALLTIKEKELAQVLDKNQELLDQIELLKFNNNYLQEKHKELQHTVKANQDLQHENANLLIKLSQLNDKESEISSLSESVSKLADENDILQLKLEALEKDKLELQKLRVLYNELLQTTEELNAKLIPEQQKDDELVEIQRSYEDLDSENSILRLQVASTQKELADLSDKYDKVISTSLEAENNLREENLKLADEISMLHMKLEAKGADIACIKDQITRYKSIETSYKALEKEISSYRTEIPQQLNRFFEVILSCFEDHFIPLEKFENRLKQLEFKFLSITRVFMNHHQNPELESKLTNFQELYSEELKRLESDKQQLESDYKIRLELLTSEKDTQIKDFENQLEALKSDRDLLKIEYETLTDRLHKSESNLSEPQATSPARRNSIPMVDKNIATEDRTNPIQIPLICDADLYSNDITPVLISESASRGDSMRTSRRELSLSEISRESEGSKYASVINKYQEENYDLENTIRLQAQQVKTLNEEIKALRTQLSTNQAYNDLMTIRNMFWGFVTSLPTQTLELEKVVKLIMSLLGYRSEDIARCEAERISKRIASAPEKKNALSKLFQMKRSN